MIVQACINGAREKHYHPCLPLDTPAMVRDSIAAVEAGAAELHIHARNEAGAESLSAVGTMVTAVRSACPGTLIGVSTGAWIEADPQRTRAAIAAWTALPDHASVNLSEPDAPAVMELLRRRGVCIEAGLATVADAERFVALPIHALVLRVLIEIDHQTLSEALAEVDAIAAVLDRSAVRRPVLLHGSDATVWPLVEQARQRRWSTRVGLEDGRHMPDGSDAPDNAALVTAAIAIYRR